MDLDLYGRLARADRFITQVTLKEIVATKDDERAAKSTTNV